MIHVTPQGSLPIVRQVADADDSTTYYVQAVIRDSVAGTILGTVNLVSQGSQRYTYNFPAPQDPSGQGRYIDITTTVYTDAGHTTRTGVYADENTTYLVKSDTQLGGGIGMGAEISYSEIRKIIKDELSKLELPQPKEPKDVLPQLTKVETSLKEAITQAVGSIRIPEQVKPDLDRVISELRNDLDTVINTILLAVDNKEVTPETDLTPVLQAVDNLPVQELIDVYGQAQDMVETLKAIVETQEEMNTLRGAAEQFLNTVQTKKLPEVKKTNPMQERARRLLGNPQIA